MQQTYIKTVDNLFLKPVNDEQDVFDKRQSILIQFCDLFSSITTACFYVMDIKNQKIYIHNPDNLFGYSFSEDDLVQGFDFYKKIVFPDDLRLWSEMRNAVLRYLQNSDRNILKNLLEISIHINKTTNITKLIPFLKSLPENLTYNIIGNIGGVTKYTELLSFFDQHPAAKNILCSYKDVIALQPAFENIFSYRISVRFPINMRLWEHSRQLLLNQTLPFEYVFDISSEDDCKQADSLVEKFQIEKYRLNPVYTGENIRFFEENVFLTKEDILSTAITLKDFFTRQSINLYDFGKINILPNGDVYANLNHFVLGNIYTDSIFEIVQKEIDDGKSWFNIRNQAPCNNCVYQWLCPPPSNYEIEIGCPNLCYVK